MPLSQLLLYISCCLYPSCYFIILYSVASIPAVTLYILLPLSQLLLYNIIFCCLYPSCYFIYSVASIPAVTLYILLPLSQLLLYIFCYLYPSCSFIYSVASIPAVTLYIMLPLITGVASLSSAISKSPKGLVHLSLSQTSVTARGVNKLAEGLCANTLIHSTLQILDLSRNSLKGEEITVFLP